MNANTEPKVTITAVITRADGTIEDLGVVATTTTVKAKLSRGTWLKRSN